jgi:capsular polysaccharide biosynthesis protein
MSADTQTRPPKSRELPDLEAEQEIDLGKYGRRLARRWWLLVIGLVVGGLIGWTFSSAASSDVNRAEATIYLGQPLSATGGSSVSSVQTNPAAVREIARSEEVVGEVAEQVGVDARRLRAGISTSQISTAVARTGQTNQLFDIAVRGPWPRATVADAANLLAAEVVERTSSYADTKIAAYEARLEELDAALDAAETSIARLTEAASDQGASSQDRLTAVTLLGFARGDRSELSEERLNVELLLAQARDVEKGQVVTEARASAVTPRSNRSSLVVGALIGLIVGLVAALAWDPIVSRRRRRAA